MAWSFDQRIARAEELADSSGVLKFYRQVASLQKPIFESVRSTGRTDLAALEPYFEPLLDLVSANGPAGLAEHGRERLSLNLLQTTWNGASEDPHGRFFARVLLQPYAEYLASRADIPPAPEAATCPFCGGLPVAGVLRGEGDGAKRWMLCSLCSTEWLFRRVLCPYCREEDKEKLPVYVAPDFPAVRVDACDTCRIYLKSVDLTKDGRAVPIVDEIASVALSIWAEEHGYGKLQPNLLEM